MPPALSLIGKCTSEINSVHTDDANFAFIRIAFFLKSAFALSSVFYDLCQFVIGSSLQVLPWFR
jgi:hypothetical protein